MLLVSFSWRRQSFTCLTVLAHVKLFDIYKSIAGHQSYLSLPLSCHITVVYFKAISDKRCFFKKVCAGQTLPLTDIQVRLRPTCNCDVVQTKYLTAEESCFSLSVSYRQGCRHSVLVRAVSLWHRVARALSLWNRPARAISLWHREARAFSLWHLAAHAVSLWHRETHAISLWHRETRYFTVTSCSTCYFTVTSWSRVFPQRALLFCVSL